MGSFSRPRMIIERRATTDSVSTHRSTEQVCFHATENIMTENSSSLSSSSSPNLTNINSQHQLNDYFEFDVVYALDQAVVVLETVGSLVTLDNIQKT